MWPDRHRAGPRRSVSRPGPPSKRQPGLAGRHASGVPGPSAAQPGLAPSTTTHCLAEPKAARPPRARRSRAPRTPRRPTTERIGGVSFGGASGSGPSGVDTGCRAAGLAEYRAARLDACDAARCCSPFQAALGGPGYDARPQSRIGEQRTSRTAGQPGSRTAGQPGSLSARQGHRRGAPGSQARQAPGKATVAEWRSRRVRRATCCSPFRAALGGPEHDGRPQT